MAVQPEVVRHSELINQRIFDRHTLEEIGRVEVLWMYTPIHQVLGFIVKSGFLGKQKGAFKLGQLYQMGEDGILVDSEPEATDIDHVRQLESPLHYEVWSQDGSELGKVIDYRFDLRTGKITHYLIAPGHWNPIIDGIYQFPPKQIVSLEPDRLVVKATQTSLKLYQEGLRQKLQEVGETLQDDYLDLTDGMQREARSLTRKVRLITDQAKGQWYSLTGQAKEKAQIWTEQAREKAQTLNDQWTEEGQTLVEQVKGKGQTLVERLQEQTHGFKEFIEEQAQILQEQVRSRRDPAVEQTIDVKPLEVIALPPSEPIQRTRGMGRSHTAVMEEDPWDTPTLPDAAPLPTPAPTLPAVQSTTPVDDDDDEPWI